MNCNRNQQIVPFFSNIAKNKMRNKCDVQLNQKYWVESVYLQIKRQMACGKHAGANQTADLFGIWQAKQVVLQKPRYSTSSHRATINK